MYIKKWKDTGKESGTILDKMDAENIPQRYISNKILKH